MNVSPNGDIIAISYSQSSVVNNTAQADDTDRIALIDAISGQITKILTISSSIGKIKFSPKENILLSFIDGNVNLWDINTEQKVLEIKLKGGGAYAVFSPDGRQFAIAMGAIWETPAPPIVCLYETKTGKLLREFPRDYSEVTGIEFSPDGNSLLIGGFKMPDVTTKLWNLDLPNSQTPKIILAQDKKLVENYSFSPNGTLLAYSMFRSGKPIVVVIDLFSNKIIKTFRVDSEVESLEFSTNGIQLAFGTRKGQIIIHSLK